MLHRIRVNAGREGGGLRISRLHTHLRKEEIGEVPAPSMHLEQTMRAKLKMIREDLYRKRHLPVPVQRQKLEAVVRAYFAYHGVPTNIRRLGRFRTEVVRPWLHALRRQNQRSRTTLGTDAPSSDSLGSNSACASPIPLGPLG
jgi:hypothetical protein